jgi:hypothetical protein
VYAKYKPIQNENEELFYHWKLGIKGGTSIPQPEFILINIKAFIATKKYLKRLSLVALLYWYLVATENNLKKYFIELLHNLEKYL